MGDAKGNYENYDELKPWYVWIGFIVAAVLTFWIQAVVTEERFVPALNVIAQWLEMPDDVAGATLMAGGASMPELFGSFAALFITHSALGIGTIVGSGIFNHLLICAGAGLAARGNQLQLDPLILFREASFYALSIALLLFALSQKEIVDDDVDYEPHIIITAFEGGLLLSGYILYIIVCVNFSKIVSNMRQFPFFSECFDHFAKEMCYDSSTPSINSDEFSRMTSFKKIDVPKIPFLRHVEHEPKHNFLDDVNSVGSNHTDGDHSVYMLDFFKPSDLSGIDSMDINKEDGSFSCFLWQQSFFYNKARIDVNSWQLRWFRFSPKGIESSRKRGSKHKTKYSTISKVEVDEDHLLLKLHRAKTSRPPYILMAGNRKVLFRVVEACDEMLKCIPLKSDVSSLGSNTTMETKDTEALVLDHVYYEDEHHRSLISYPYDRSHFERILYYFLLPFKAAIHFTIPDVRVDEIGLGPPLRKTFLCIILCILWLILSSYVLVESLENIGELMHIPDAIIGITVSAAGTSVANFVASQCAAKQGLGNMAVSNAFGSNSFIIFVGLGLPWLTFCVSEGGGAYYKLRDEGLTESVILMAFFLFLFMVLMWWHRFVLYRSHAYLFIFGYFLYISFVLARAYFQNH